MPGAAERRPFRHSPLRWAEFVSIAPGASGDARNVPGDRDHGTFSGIVVTNQRPTLGARPAGGQVPIAYRPGCGQRPLKTCLATTVHGPSRRRLFDSHHTLPASAKLLAVLRGLVPCHMIQRIKRIKHFR